MPTTYTLAVDVQKMWKHVLDTYRRDLADAGVTTDILFASNLDDSPLKSHGFPAAATIKIQPLKQRATGNADSLLCIDYHQWTRFTEAQRIALLHHEAVHLTLTLDDDNNVKRDDLNRPKMKLRVHDNECGIFTEVITQHGRDALDVHVSEQVYAAAQKALSGEIE